MIHSNVTELRLNVSNIFRDFDIFHCKQIIFEEEERSEIIKNNLLFEKNIQQLPIQAVFFKKGYFLLINKGDCFISDIEMAVPENYTVTRINNANRFSYQMFNNQLAQLICNKLPELYISDNGFINTDTRLYYCNPEWQIKTKKIRNVVEFQLVFGDKLKISVKSFHEPDKNETNKTKFYWDSKNEVLRKCLKPEDFFQSQIYVVGTGDNSKKNDIDFANLVDFEKYPDTKVGLIDMFLSDVNQYLGDYLHIELKKIYPEKYQEAEKIKKKVSYSNYVEIIGQDTIFIADNVKSSESDKLVQGFMEEIKKVPELESLKFELVNAPKEGLNINLNHEKEYFRYHKEEQDTYVPSTKEKIIQNMTLESFDFLWRKTKNTKMNQKTNSKERELHAGIVKVLQELMIKKIIFDRQLPKFMIEHMSLDAPLHFLIPKEIDGNKTFDHLSIGKKGDLSFKSYNEFINVEDAKLVEQNLEELIKIHKRVHNENIFDNQIKGILYQNIDDLVLIRENGLFTIPNLEFLRKDLELASDFNMLSREAVLDFFMNFFENSFMDIEVEGIKGQLSQIKDSYEKVKEFDSIFELQKLKKVLYKKGKVARTFMDQFYDHFEMQLVPANRRKEYQEYVAGFVGINFVNKIGNRNGHFYFVGKSITSLETSYKKTSIIREIVRKENSQFDLNLFQRMLDVEFVRTWGYTVIPFPFKILRDYIKLIGDGNK